MKNIVLHDIFDIRGGGERLALVMAEGLGADLCFGKHSSKSFDLDTYHKGEKFDLRLKLELPGFKTWRLSKLFRERTSFLKGYDNVIYSGIVCPLAIHHHKQSSNFYYCHTPPRFVYDKFDHYMNQYSYPQGVVLKTLVNWYKSQYEEAVSLMDMVFANSQFVKERIKKYLKRDSVIIYPPCEVNKYECNPDQGFYLSTARFDPLKRVDKVIEAFLNMPDKQLVVCSHGSEEHKLKALAGDAPNIQFVGQVSDSTLRKLLSECIASIYIPKDEDFGMSPVESMASGKPVICSGHGGPIESVIDEQTGFYIDEDDLVEGLCRKVRQMTPEVAKKMSSDCLERAKKFSDIKFVERLKQFIY